VPPLARPVVGAAVTECEAPLVEVLELITQSFDQVVGRVPEGRGLGTRPDAILAPQKGISRDAKGNATALVVNAEGKVEARVVQTAQTVGDQWLVDSGLEAGDRVIVEGLQKVQPGASATVVEAGQPAAAGAAPMQDADASHAAE